MKAHLMAYWSIAVIVLGSTHDPGNAAPTPWAQIRLLSHDRSGDVGEYIRSLTKEEMLTAARQACQEVEENPDGYRDASPWAVAQFHCMICLEYYFDKVDRDEGGANLLKIVRDPSESYFLRRALISRMGEPVDMAFDVKWQAYVKANQVAVTGLLTRILKDKQEPWLVREGSMDYLAGQVETEVGKIIRADRNAHAVWERTHTFAFVGKMLRSGELTLTEDTLNALKPLEERTIAYVKLLGAILANENEPEELRKQVKRRLEGYRESPLTGIDAEVEKALRGRSG